MAKKADLRAAKEKRQKKIALVGGVLLLVVLGVQVPRTMSMLRGPEPAEAVVPTTSVPVPAGQGGAATLEPPALSGDAGVAADPAAAAPAAAEPVGGKLVSFGRFESKDPFVQQVGAPAGGDGDDEAAAEGEEPAAGAEDGAEPASGEEGSGGAAAPSATASISVNGTVETVAEGASFPTAAPAFTLKAVGKSSVTLAVAEGGSFAQGDATLELRVGEPVTLVNTADGSRYVLLLKSVG